MSSKDSPACFQRFFACKARQLASRDSDLCHLVLLLLVLSALSRRGAEEEKAWKIYGQNQVHVYCVGSTACEELRRRLISASCGLSDERNLLQFNSHDQQSN